MSEIQIDATREKIRITAEGAAAVLIGSGIFCILIFGAYRFL